MNMRRSILLPAALAALAALPAAAAPDKAKVAAIFADVTRADAPGCAAGIVLDGRQLPATAYGAADIAAGRQLAGDTLFDAASVSKQFTAFAILLLQKQGKLSLDDSVRKHVPELAAYAQPITVRHLLHHTSGLRDIVSLSRIRAENPGRPIDTADAWEILSRQVSAEVPPGIEQTYSNTGYALLARIAERAGGQPLAGFLQQHVFNPLGMKNTRVGDTDLSVGGTMARSYMAAGGNFRQADVSALLLGAGGMRTTVGDLGKWAANFWTGKAGGSDVMRQMTEVGSLNDGSRIDYAGGVTIGRYRGLVTANHGGSVDGFRNRLLVIPSQKFAAAVLCNRSDGAPGERSEALADLYLAGRLQPKPALPEGAQIEAPDRIDPSAATTGSYRDRKSAEYLRFRRDEQGKPVLDYRGRSFPLQLVAGHVYKTEPLQSFPIYVAFSPDRMSMAYAGYRDEFLPVADWTPADPARWAGSYWSDEAQARIRIEMTETGLVAEMGGNKTPLRPGRQGEFILGRGALLVPVGGPADSVGLHIVGLRGLRFLREPAPPPR